MNSVNIEQIGIGGILALMILKETFSFLKFRGSEQPHEIRQKIYDTLNTMKFQISELHQWHNIEDADGIKLWYVSSGFRKVITSIDENIVKNTIVLEKVARELRSMREDRTVDKGSEE